MGENTLIMELKQKIVWFDYFNNGIKIGSSAIQKEISGSEFIDVSFPFRQIIGFLDSKNTYVRIDLMANFEDTKIKSLSWRNFSLPILRKLSKLLNLQLVELNENVVFLKIPENGNIASLALKKSPEASTIVIYSLELPDLYRGAGPFNGTLFVHCIWEVKDADGLNIN